MQVSILLFAGLRETLRTDRISVDLPPGSTVAQLLAAVGAAQPRLRDRLAICRVAVDEVFVDTDQPIPEGAEVALIPPVSGGHDGPEPAALRRDPISLDDVMAAVRHEGAGGITTFTGAVRRHSRGKTVARLEYEAYDGMVLKTLRTIIETIESEIDGSRVAIHHRVGTLHVGDVAVVIAASAPHRAQAFAACRRAIEWLKEAVPIWKKEVADDGEEWIGTGP